MQNPNYQAALRLLLDAIQKGTSHHEVVLEVCKTPAYLTNVGFPDLPVFIKAGTVDKAHFDHGITRSLLERLGSIICSPKALYRSATQPDSAVVIAFETKDGCPLLVPMRPNQPVGRLRVNLVSSVYIKQADIEARWQREGLLLWQHK